VNVGIGFEVEKSEKNLTTREECERESERNAQDPMSGLAGALGRGLGTKDVPLKNVRAVFRQGHGGAGDLHSVKILVLIGRQGRIQVGHQRGDSYLITNGIGGSKQVTNGFVYKVGASTDDNQYLVLQPELESIGTHRPAAVLKSTAP
jgi:hypothetical protein